ncbi:hypothetical protein HpBGD52_09640 [Helicobacter pylori]
MRGGGRFSVFNVHCVADTIIGVHNFFNKTTTKQLINLSVVGFLKFIKPIGNPNKNARNTAQLKGGIEAGASVLSLF